MCLVKLPSSLCCRQRSVSCIYIPAKNSCFIMRHTHTRHITYTLQSSVHTNTHTNTYKHTQTHTNTHKHTQTHTNNQRHKHKHTQRAHTTCSRNICAQHAQTHIFASTFSHGHPPTTPPCHHPHVIFRHLFATFFTQYLLCTFFTNFFMTHNVCLTQIFFKKLFAAFLPAHCLPFHVIQIGLVSCGL